MGYETGNCTRKARIFGRFTSRRRIDGAGWELMGVVMERGFGWASAQRMHVTHDSLLELVQPRPAYASLALVPLHLFRIFP
uniref:Uncharacterized protein n=1 Tax=Candidozyma auris TaxID=498019 RepID=A0A0L0NU33_CANAR